MIKQFVEIFILVSCVITVINGHGYMVSPPARNSMWRFGFPNPTNYNDNQLFCGGSATQKKNNGKCGICGDPANQKVQPHSDGGKYANGIIGKTYRKGEVITVNVLLTASHKGFFEFRIGEYDNSVIQGDAYGRLKGFLLRQTNGDTKYQITNNGKMLTINLQLPQNLTCKRCVMQWWYKTGNSWGCELGKCGLGLGHQEHFVNCADVSIV